MALPPIDDADYVWFRKTFDGLFWRPVSVEGWIVTAIWAVSNIWYFRKAEAATHSVSDTFIEFGFFAILSTLVLLAIVHHTKGRRWE